MNRRSSALSFSILAILIATVAVWKLQHTPQETLWAPVTRSAQSMDRPDPAPETQPPLTETAALEKQLEQQPAAPSTHTSPAAPTHPSAALMAASRVVSEHWGVPDTLGNREHIAILKTSGFKFPWVRIVEQWSGKTGQLVSRVAMVADHVMLVPKPGIDPAVLDQALTESGFTIRNRESGSFMLAAFSGDITQIEQVPEKIATLASWHQLVELAEPDYLVWPCAVPSDPGYASGTLWALNNPGTVGGYQIDADIDAPEGWNVRHDAPNIIVAVTDSGIRYDHEDLAANMWHNALETAGDGIDNDGNGVVDDVYGIDATTGGGNPMDTDGHGTHCAGTIGARANNGVGLCGVAWNVQLMAAKFLSPQGGATSDAIKAINYSRRMGAHIINASWGGEGFSNTLRQAIADCAVANIAFVAAAGNEGTDNDSAPQYPASYDLSNIISVAATDATDNLTGSSCYGNDSVDIAAPGWQIWSCASSGTNAYQYLQGTSMAAAHVSGALALARAQYPSEPVELLIARMCQSADALPALAGRVRSGGRLNLAGLLNSTAPVTNDSFDTPFTFSGNYGTWSGSNVAATRDADEDLYALPGARTLWFAWQPSFTGMVELTSQSLGANVRIAVYSGDNRIQLHYCTDSTKNNPNEPNITLFYAQLGSSYRIVTLSDSPAGERFSLSLSAVGRNDAITSPLLVPGSSFSITDSNRSATCDGWERAKPHAGVGAGKSMWYDWIAPFSGPFTLNTQGSGFDTVLAVYTGYLTEPWNFLCVASNDDSGPMTTWSACTFEAVKGKAYIIAVDSAQGTPGGSIKLTGLRPAPVVITAQPEPLTLAAGSSAVFSVSVSGSAPFSYQWFRDGSPIPGALAATLTLDPVNAADFATYQVSVSNAFATVTSTSVLLTETASPPSIIWTGGAQTVSPDTEATLRIKANGSVPLTYQWSRGGSNIDGATNPSLTFPAPQTSDSGSYRCTVTNALGSAQASVPLNVVGSPWQGWQWRRDNVPNAPINEIKVIDNRCVAVAGDRLLVSSDAQEWETVMLPENFTAASVAKLGSLWICTGEDRDANPRVITSSDGLIWSPPVASTGVMPLDTESSVLRQVETFAGRFVAWNGNSSDTEGGRVHYSSDGIVWTPATATFLTGTSGMFSTPCRLAGNGIQMIVPGSSTASTTRVLRSTDGMAWTEVKTSDTYVISSQMVYYAAGAWHSHVYGSHFTSPDGLTWQSASAPVLIISTSSAMRAISLGNEVFWYSPGLNYFAWGDPSTISSFTAFAPSNAPRITAAAAFQGGLIYGTSSGTLGMASSRNNFKPSATAAGSYSNLIFLNDEFIASGNDGNCMFSGDGMHWNPGANLDVPVKKIIGYAGSRYYTNNWTTKYQTIGYLPDGLTETATEVWPNSMDCNGSVSVARCGNSLMRSTDYGVTWTTVTSAPYVDDGSIVSWSGNRWFLTQAAATLNELVSNPYLYHSADGLTWTPVYTVYATRVTKLGSKWFAMGDSLNSNTTVVWESDNGTSWTALPRTGLPDAFRLLKVVSFNNTLVAHLYYEYRTAVYYSSDGRGWIRANLPAKVIDIETGLGKLVALTSNGGTIETGPVHPGGSAPIIQVNYPGPVTYHLLGSTVEITGSYSDPEGSPTTLSCIANGTTLATQTTAGEFRFRFKITDPKGYAIRLRAVDAEGLVTATSLRVLATSPQLPNLFTSVGKGSTFITGNLLEFFGAVYAASNDALWRSQDGGFSWQKVAIPSSISNGYAPTIATGNGALVLQLGPAEFATTRNGTDWDAIAVPSLSGGSLTSNVPLCFQSGWFTAVFTEAGTYGTTLISKDGITWVRGLASSTVFWTDWINIDKDGTLLISQSGTTISGLYRSTDFGKTWETVTTFTATAPPRVTYFNGCYLAVAGSKSKSWTSTDAMTWTPGYSFSEYMRMNQVGDRLFARNDNLQTTYISTDGVTWVPLTGVRPSTVLAGSSRMGFLSKEYNSPAFLGPVWSADGVVWQRIVNGPTTLSSALLGNDGFLIVDNSGALWHSPNGTTWTKRLTGQSATTVASGTPSFVVPFGSRLLVGGTSGMLHLSGENLLGWTGATLDGAAITTSSTVKQLISNNTRALAIIYTSSPKSTGVFKTTNGTAWTRLTLPTVTNVRTINAIADNGTSIMITGCTGTSAYSADSVGYVLKSSDGGATWSQPSTTGLLIGAAMTYYKNQWIVIGTDTAGSLGSARPLKVFSSTNGTTWTKGNGIGLSYDGYSSFPRLLAAHNRLACWTWSTPVSSTNGTIWTSMALINPGSTSQPAVDLTYTSTGWLAVYPFSTSGSTDTRTEMWTAPPDGSVWTSIPPLQEQITGVENVDNRIFFVGGGFLKEWTEKDFSIELAEASPATLGVGDTLTCSAILSNLGSLSSAESLSVDAWLSPDGFYGDTNDIYLGRIPLGSTLPAPGAATTVNLNFVLPYTIRPGEMHLILRLDPESKLYESNTSNNVSVSKSAMASIPARQLSLVSNGNGSIVADQLAEYYPHKARIALIARPGKGTYFAGWSGDASTSASSTGPLGSLDESLVILDSNKSVTANFASTSKLSVSIRGNGNVTLDHADGLYQPNETATLHAEPLIGWSFIGWGGALSGTNPDATLPMETSKAVVANFTMTQENWTASCFSIEERSNLSISGPDADPDADGMPNWREWLQGSEPKSALSRGQTPTSFDGSDCVFTYTRMECMPDGYSISCVASDDLSNWSLPLSERVIERTNGIETIEVRLDTTERPHAFFSVTAQRPSGSTTD